MMIHPPSIVLLGAPGTGAQALCAALQQRLANQAVRIAWSHTLEGIAPAVRAADAGSPLLLLLMGLDQPCPDSDRPAQEAADASLRAALARSGAGYQVVYGQGKQRVASALNALKNIAPGALPASDSGGLEPLVEENPVRSARLRAWNCEKCSDPECEHRLFTALTGRDSQRG